MKYFIYILLTLLIFSSCSNNDEPTPEVYTQVSKITNGSSITQTIIYDSFDQVTRYVSTVFEDEITATYSYPSDNLIKIHTEIITNWGKNNSTTRKYDEEVYLEKGLIAYCDGIFSTDEFGTIIHKKFRQEFTYTADNHLNVVKWTQWNKKGDDWDYESPWSWGNYYIWKNNNLVTIEDYLGNSSPTYTYNYTYSSVSGIQNVIPLHFGMGQYYPLQLKGYLGLTSENLIAGKETIAPNAPIIKAQYEYDIEQNKVIRYSETRNGILTEDYSVSWTK